MRYTVSLAAAAFMAGQPATAQTLEVYPDTGATLSTIPDFVDYESLPRKAGITDLSTVADLRDVRVLQYDNRTGEEIERYIVELAYVRRDGRVLLSDYLAFATDGSLIEYHLPGQAGDTPLTDLTKIDQGQEHYILFASLPEGSRALDDALTAAAFTQERFLARYAPAPEARAGGRDRAREQLEKRALAWIDRQDALQVQVIESSYFTDAEGVLRPGRTVYQTRYQGLVVRLKLPPPAVGGGKILTMGASCFASRVQKCKSSCSTACNTAPCSCPGVGSCTSATVSKCKNAAGACPAMGRSQPCAWVAGGGGGGGFLAVELSCVCL